jgi:hypothetical protein
MSKSEIAPEQLTLLQHIGRIVDLSEKNGLDDVFFVKAKAYLEHLSAKFNISPLQAALFPLFVARGDDTSISPDNIAESAKWKIIKVLQHMNDFDELVKKKLLIATKIRYGSKRFRVTPAVMNSLIKNTPVEIKENTDLDIFDFFDILETLIDLRSDGEISSEDFIFETNKLLEDNKNLKISQTIKGCRLKENLQATLLLFCEKLVNNDDDEINFNQIESIFESASEFRRIKESFRGRDNALFKKNIIKNTTSDGFGSRETFNITDKAKRELFPEINTYSIGAKSKQGLILSSSIVKKNCCIIPI